MGGADRLVFRSGLVEIAGSEVEIAKHAIGFRVIGEFLLRLAQKILGLFALALLHIKTREVRREARDSEYR